MTRWIPIPSSRTLTPLSWIIEMYEESVCVREREREREREKEREREPARSKLMTSIVSQEGQRLRPVT